MFQLKRSIELHVFHQTFVPYFSMSTVKINVLLHGVHTHTFTLSF